MAFRNDAYATLWEHKSGNGNYHEGRISTSKKRNGKYEDDFSGYVRFIGDAKIKAEKLSNKRYRIKINSCEVTNRYDREKKQEYFNFAIFDFEVVDNESKEEKDNNKSFSKNDTQNVNKNNSSEFDITQFNLSNLSPEQITALLTAIK